MKEAEFATRIEETANFLQLRWYHPYDSRKSNGGFPDYTIVGPYGVLFLEIKSDKGKPTPQQEAWIKDLAAAWAPHQVAPGDSGVDSARAVTAYVAYPRDWNRVLSDLKRIAGR